MVIATSMPYQVKNNFQQRKGRRKQDKSMAGLRMERNAFKDGGGHVGARNDRGHGKYVWQGQGEPALLAILRERLIDEAVQLSFG